MYIYIYIYKIIFINLCIHHRAAGTVACTMSTQGPLTNHPVFQSYSFPIFQSSSFPDPVPVGVGVWRPILENPFLGGCRGAPCERSRGFLPPRRSPRRLSSPILPRLGAPVRYLGTKMPQHLPRYPKNHHLGANIFQHNSQNPPKTASRTLQRRPQLPKNHQKC